MYVLCNHFIPVHSTQPRSLVPEYYLGSRIRTLFLTMHSSLAFLGLAATAQAATHDLIFGTFGTAFLYTAEFDDEALTLSLKANTTVADPSSWLALSVRPLQAFPARGLN